MNLEFSKLSNFTKSLLSNMSQQKIAEILKHKGIGPQGSKHIPDQEVLELPDLLMHTGCSLTTKATLLTALLLLDPSTQELEVLERLKTTYLQLPIQLHFFFQPHSEHPLEQLILQLTQHQDLTEAQAKLGVETAFDKNCPAHLCAAFLEGLRLKRETDLENQTFYKYFLSQTKRIKTNRPFLIEIGDSYDGVNRNNNYNLFTALVLASLDYPTLLTGNQTVAPKMGNTHHQILSAAGKNPLISLEKAKEQLENTFWAYVDQAIYYPELWQQAQMRKEMIKRPFIATFEKILSPFTGIYGNYVVTSYTHAHYKQANITILKNNPYCKEALNIKGLEGTISPKHNVSVPVIKMTDGEESSYRFDTDQLPDAQIGVEACLAQGLDFITNNTDNQAKSYVRNTVALVLIHLGFEKDREVLFQKIDAVVENGTVLNKWNMGN